MSNDVQALHRIIRGLCHWSLPTFYTEIRVIGGENVPKDGPIIVTATHHNMMLDPAVLSVSFPHQRILNYWSKASLFANPILRWVLLSSGNIPVDRKSKDRNVLFKGTFDALSQGKAVALFPEGTSYTEPRIMQIKDGAAWAALMFTKHMNDKGIKNMKEVKIVPAAIVYTNKSKFRSAVVVEYGEPISVDEYKEQFFSEAEGAQRAAVKRLTRTVESALMSTTINAPDWDTLYAARMARELLWEGDAKSINLDEFVPVSQTLVDLFSSPEIAPNFNSVKRHLLEYYSLLQSSKLSNSALSSLPLPRSLDPNVPAPLPSRVYTVMILIRDTISALIRIPFFIVPLIVFLPVYLVGRWGAGLVKDEEESQAQNKVVFGLLSLLLIYPTAFFSLWSTFRYTPTGAAIAVSLVYFVHKYHRLMIDANYEQAKRLMAAWRVLVGVWVPKRWDLSVPALAPYLKPVLPKENPWVERPKTPTQTPGQRDTNGNSYFPSSAGISNPVAIEEPPVSARPKRRPPSRRLVRHVLRARVEAVKALASFFNHLHKAQGSQMHSSLHLAQEFGTVKTVRKEGIEEEVGYRDVHEVLAFLKKRGAKGPLQGTGDISAEWAALTSEAEGEGYSTHEE